MKLSYFFAVLLLATQAPAALAATLYKCVDQSGKVAYADQPCAEKTSAAKTLHVAKHETENERAWRLRKAEQVNKELQEQSRLEQQNQRFARDNYYYEQEKRRYWERLKRDRADSEARAAARQRDIALSRMSPEARKLNELRCAGLRDANC